MHWTDLLWRLRDQEVRIHSDITTVVAFITYQDSVLQWVRQCVLASSAVHNPSIMKWQLDCLSCHGLNQWVWFLHTDKFHQICLHWRTVGSVLVSCPHDWVPRFVTGARDPWQLHQLRW